MTPEVGKTYWYMEDESAEAAVCNGKRDNGYTEFAREDGSPSFFLWEDDFYILYESPASCYAAAIERLRAKLKAELAKERGDTCQ